MSLLPNLTATSVANSIPNYLFATQAQFASLSTSLSSVSISTSTGAGVSVTEPLPNRFVFANALSNAGGLSFVSVPGSSTLGLSNAGVTGLVAGSGIGVSGSTGNVTVSNSGVLSVSAGSNVVVGGTASAPVINASLTTNVSQVNLQPGALPGATATGPSASALVSYPVFGSATTIPVVAGGVYSLNGSYLITTTSGGYGIEVAVENGGSDVMILDGTSAPYVAGAAQRSVPIPFSALVQASSSTIGMYVNNGAAAGGGDVTTIDLEPLYITRLL
jgi:hypothetical protein